MSRDRGGAVKGRDLEDKVAVVMGGTRGIGGAISLELGRRGGRV
jgi:NAD(P)-dependent dehydrogenase (short-subunit alcohol dehydrogenase family)